MTTSFQQREQAFEAKFAHDEEFRYLVRARRDRLFAEWAAAQVALPPPQAAELVASVLHVPDGAQHDEAVLSGIAAVLQAGQRPMTRPELSGVLARHAAQARDERLAQPLDHTDQR